MKPWRLGMHVVCVDTNWHRPAIAGERRPQKGDVLIIAMIDWSDRPANHSRCGLAFEGIDQGWGNFCDCHFKPATKPPVERVTRRAPSPARNRILEEA